MKHAILASLREHGPTRVRHIPATWLLPESRVQALVRELIEDGLVEASGPGRAHWLLSLTPAGRRRARSGQDAA